MTKTEVLAIYKGLIDKIGADPRNDPRDLLLHAWRGTRTIVHASLEVENPQPYNDLPEFAKLGHVLDAARGSGTRAFTRRELDQIVAHKRSLVSEEHHKAFDAREGKGKPHDVVDPHHHVQKLHGMALWAAADKAVLDAGITEKGLVV